MFNRMILLLLAVTTLVVPAVASASEGQAAAATTWRLLDYIAVDYAGAVVDGQVISRAEYAEMGEFSSTVENQISSLEDKPLKSRLIAEAQELRGAIKGKADPKRVASLARALGAGLLQAYPVPSAPKAAPDMSRGASLYREKCSACHGVSGNGHGPMAAKLDPAPVDFTSRSRADQRSVFALEQVISQGLEGTAMQSFGEMPEMDRWAMAFHVSTLSYPRDVVAEGERLWRSDPSLRNKIPDLKTLVGLSSQALAGDIGTARASAILAYLRHTPTALQRDPGGSLAFTRNRLAESFAAYAKGDPDGARRLALSAYLDGFEPIEPVLSARNASLLRKIEEAMGEFRSRIGQGQPLTQVEAQAHVLDLLFGQAEQALADTPAGGLSTFLGALTVLLREGVEALLLIVGMIAFLKKSGREDAVAYVHGGWIAALSAGFLTWLAATAFLRISGASRELTEGFGGIFAALVLVSVGIWMHGKGQADTWQRYLKRQMNRALGRGSAWFLFGLAFLVVYREVFETILFYTAMWTEGAEAAIIGGAAAGAAALTLIAWAMFRYSARLPITEFFRYSSVLIGGLAIIIAGKGVAAIQEAGLLGITPVAGIPQIDIVGLHPSAQVVGAQLALLIALLVGFRMNSRRKALDAEPA